jgi:hypothetical protein
VLSPSSYPLPPPPPQMTIREITYIIIVVTIPLSYGLWNMDTGICQINQYSFIGSALWLVSYAVLEIAIVSWLLVYLKIDNFIVAALLWMLSIVYGVWTFIGIDMFICNCLIVFDIGSIFVGFALVSGAVIAIRNLILIKRIEKNMCSNSTTTQEDRNHYYYLNIV